MDYAAKILTLLALAAAAGVAAAWFRRSQGKESVEILRTLVEAYKETDLKQKEEIRNLKSTIVGRDKTISNLRGTIKTMIREFKDYKANE